MNEDRLKNMNVYESDANLDTEKESKKIHETDGSGSMDSWNTVDINDDTQIKLKRAAICMNVIISFNIVLSMMTFSLIITCVY